VLSPEKDDPVFTLSSKAVYGLTALVELALHQGAGPLQIGEIARRHGIPQHYLEQILSALRRGGYVRSFRGARGGYELARAAELITVEEILTQLDGPVAVLPTGTAGSSLHPFWQELERHVTSFLSLSLGDLARQHGATGPDADFMI
jgi:Rrf2 family transcriptional regulator, cysteine metabolism repressor